MFPFAQRRIGSVFEIVDPDVPTVDSLADVCEFPAVGREVRGQFIQIGEGNLLHGPPSSGAHDENIEIAVQVEGECNAAAVRRKGKCRSVPSRNVFCV
jgi:hypothetical protein